MKKDINNFGEEPESMPVDEEPASMPVDEECIM